jgi:hypothetical protein
MCHTFSFCENFDACFIWQTFPCCMHISCCGCGRSTDRKLKHETNRRWRAQSNRQIVQSEGDERQTGIGAWAHEKSMQSSAFAGGGGGANATQLCTPQPIQLMFWFIRTSIGSLLSSALPFMDIHKLINNCFVVSTWCVSVSHLRGPLFAA